MIIAPRGRGRRTLLHNSVSLDGEPRLMLEYSTVALGKHSALHYYVISGKFGAPHIRPA